MSVLFFLNLNEIQSSTGYMHQKLSECPLQSPEAAGIYLLKINNRNRTVRENMF